VGIWPTVRVSDRGELTAGLNDWDGFAALIDFAGPPLELEILPPGVPTAIGIARTGQALRDSMAGGR
jgi:hypothetical protein